MAFPDGVVLIDGAPVPPAEAMISPFDRGFLYGDTVFETMRAYSGVVLDLELHLERFLRSAEAVAMHLSAPLATFRSEILAALRLVAPGDWVVRLTHSRGTGSVLTDPRSIRNGHRIVMVTPFQGYPQKLYQEGATATLATRVRPARLGRNCAPKHGNYLHAVVGTLMLSDDDAHEAFVLDDDGYVIEGLSSNICWVRSGRLGVPPPSSDILEGITQGRVLELARELTIGVQVERLLPSELLAQDEVFICSSLRELVPVVQVDGTRVGAGTPGPVFARLFSAYRTRVEGKVRAGASA